MHHRNLFHVSAYCYGRNLHTLCNPFQMWDTIACSTHVKVIIMMRLIFVSQISQWNRRLYYKRSGYWIFEGLSGPVVSSHTMYMYVSGRYLVHTVSLCKVYTAQLRWTIFLGIRNNFIFLCYILSGDLCLKINLSARPTRPIRWT